MIDIPQAFQFNLLMLTLIFLFKLNSFFRVVFHLSVVGSDLVLDLPTNIRQMEINNPLENSLDISTAFYVIEDWK